MVVMLRVIRPTRLLRVLRVLRVARLPGALERSMVSAQVSSRLEMIIRVAKVLAAIFWIHHILSCTWYHISTSAPSDTGLSWLAEEVGGYTNQTCEDCSIWYRYTTAFHRSLPRSCQAPGKSLCLACYFLGAISVTDLVGVNTQARMSVPS